MSTQTDQLVLADLHDYPSVPFIQTHPDRLATIGRLAGMNPAPIDRCRVLEVACGEGGNLISMAYLAPNSTFVGFDLGVTPIARANAAVAGLGFNNVEFFNRNLLDYDPGDDKFDYVIAHGFYSWVPQIVRDKLMELIARVLTPQGIAYISYNVYPGCYSGKRIRDFALLNLDTLRAANPGSLETPVEQINETRNFLELLRANPPEDAAPARADAFHEADLVLARPPSLIYHDLLSDHWDPVTFKQFLAHAGAYGLQYVEEAVPAEPDMPKVPEKVMAYIKEICAGDRLLEAQFVDFVIAKRFRRSLLCRKDVVLATQDQSPVIEHMWVSTRMTETGVNADGSVSFTIPDLVNMSTPSQVVIHILRRLIAAHPQRIAVKEFHNDNPESNRNLHSLFLRMYRGGSIDLFTRPTRAGSPTGKPVASRLARFQAGRQPALSNLVHQAIELKDDGAAWFLNLLDGTRDHDALLEEIAKRFPERSRSELGNQLFVRLDELRKLALIEDVTI